MPVVADSGGSSSEVVGRVVYANGKPVQNAVVKLRSASYLSDTMSETVQQEIPGADTVTNALGEFTVHVADTGHFFIEVNDQMKNAALLKCTASGTESRTKVPEDTLKPTGTIRGSSVLLRGITSKVYVQVYGLEKIAVEDPATGAFEITDMPAGNFTLRFVSASSNNSPTIVNNVAVVSGMATSIDTVKLALFGLWKFSKRVVLNTTLSGANVLGTVTNFPILVRLTSSTIDFAQAKTGGEDLRFAKSDGTPLPYEIERWDASLGTAEVWVKVDTVFGNDSSHFLNMYWGNPNASSASNGAAVFDTAKGFQGVWHLDEQAGTAVDATGNRFDGTPSNTAPTAVLGAIGIAQEFNGGSNFIQIRGTASGKLNFAEADTFTVSAWVYADTLIDSTSHLIVGKGHQQYYLKQFFKDWEFTEYLGGTVWQITSYAPAVAKSWKFLFGMRQGNTQFLYLDGVLINSNSSTGYPNAVKDTSNDVTIGRYLEYVTESNQGFAFFKGAIDEVRISNVSRSPDWIKLEYMNQKANSALVGFR